MRNRELGVFSALLAAVSALCALGAGILWGTGAALACLGGCGAVSALALGVTRWRYRQLAKLSRYLVQVYQGGQPVDIRDQRPGELSALKDDLYKVTSILESQRAALEQDRAFLRDFLNDIAHQLKTPLAAICLQTELWQEPTLPREAKDGCARRVEEQARRMGWLVETLLKLSRLDARAVRLEPARQPADGILRRAAGGLIPLMAQKGIELSVDCPPGVLCRCDAAWTAEALANLLKNAAEHTPAGGWIRLSAAASPVWFAFTVENAGPPIPPQELPHIFVRFYKGRDAAPASAGIGLALARAIARQQNGELFAENLPDGVRFTLRLYQPT